VADPTTPAPGAFSRLLAELAAAPRRAQEAAWERGFKPRDLLADPGERQHTRTVKVTLLVFRSEGLSLPDASAAPVRGGETSARIQRRALAQR
jgi:hypothetical protein